jgi:hypothetical protein
MKFRVPEIFLGAFLAVAMFAMGMVFHSSRYQPTDENSAKKGADGDKAHVDHSSFGDWIAQDAAGFFTFWLVVVGFGQAGLFYWQLRLIRKSLSPAENAAKAARDAADIAKDALTKLERPRILSDTPKFSVANDGSMSANFPILNFGRDPGRIREQWGKFVIGKLPDIPDFNGGKCERPNAWLLPATTFGSAREAANNLTYKFDTRADFFMFKIVYEWDFGTHEHAFACTTTEFTKGLPEAVGGAAYNYDK